MLPSLRIVDYQELVVLRPPCASPALLYGAVVLSLPRPKTIRGIVVRHVIRYELTIPGHKVERGIIRTEEETRVSGPCTLAAGEHLFEWSLKIPHDTTPGECCLYGWIRHWLEAVVEGGGILGRDLVHEKRMWAEINVAPEDDAPNYQQQQMLGLLDELGPYNITLESSCLKVGGVLDFSINLPSIPQTVAIRSITLSVTETFELSSPHPTSTSKSLRLVGPKQRIVHLDGSSPRSTPTRWAHGMAITTSEPADGEFALVEKGEGFEVLYQARIPGCDALHPSTGTARGPTPISVTHEMCVEVRYVLPERGKVRNAKLCQAIRFSSCCCTPLPPYSPEPAAVDRLPLGPRYNCACLLDIQSLVGDTKDHLPSYSSSSMTPVPDFHAKLLR
ncbi:hypothetical protein EXIGLDRAFT_832034 [Exidia glandulosa HHB12029]|uniref:Arrestin-like N-terminal domain-containing protein n=1 Tax=Exidia glandulosa HHB12029 TaxID=1314781 RepID=A0A165M108_EXIGL|nr:hypothetical protein EXIGLDRAFT_832034 [Exidia glandulosa HHB12029]